MTMDAMVRYLENHGFEATKKYNPVVRKYEFRISKNGCNFSMPFEYPVSVNQVVKDKIQRDFLDNMIVRFKKEFEDSDSLYPKTMMAVMDALKIPDSVRNFKTVTTDIDVSNWHRYYPYETRLKDLEPKKVYITTSGYKPHTIFEDFIKAKEKEMANNIKWKVDNITVDNLSRNETVLKAEIEGVARGASIANIMNISDEIRDRLNASEKSAEEYIRYCASDVTITKALNTRFGTVKRPIPEIKKVIFNNPATIVIWADETKTVVKCQNNETYDPEKGLAMAITKKALGNEGNYFEEIKKWVGDEPTLKEITHEEYQLENLKSDCQAACDKLQDAFRKKKATKADLITAMEEAIRLLREGLDT